MSESFALNGGGASFYSYLRIHLFEVSSATKVSKCDFEEFLIALLSFSGVNSDGFLNLLKDFSNQMLELLSIKCTYFLALNQKY